MGLLLVSASVGALSIGVAIWLYLRLRQTEVKNEGMREVAGYIAIGVKAYLARQFRSIILIAPFIAVALWIFNGWLVALTFTFGVVTSLTTAFVGMNAAIRANGRTAEEATKSTTDAFHTAVFGGSVMGFSIIGFSLVVLSILYGMIGDASILVGFGFGASLAALFAQIGGGIYTKSADVGADLVGKVERNIPEDDARNPAVIADLVGDNVGDCAGRGAELFETFSDDIITGMLVAATTVDRFGAAVIFFPLLLQSVGILSSLFGVYSVQLFRRHKPENAFNYGLGVTSVLAAIGAFILSKVLLNDLSIFLGAFLGITVTLVSAIFTRYYAGSAGRPVERIAEASKRGVALNLITGLGLGLQSPLASILMIIIAVSVAFRASGGLATSLLAIVAVNIGTDLLIGFIMTADAFGPIIDNAAGIAEMSGAGPKVVRTLSQLDAVGNTMKATTKAYAMSSGTVTSFVLFATFFSEVGLKTLNISSPYIIAFFFLGIAMPYLIASLVFNSTAKTALMMVDEVRRQFASIPGIMERKAKPDYRACVDIAAGHALREMLLPGLISITIPVAVGFVFKAEALGALLIGAVASAALLGPFFNNTGTAFDNAKKLIEDTGSKGSFEHQAAVAADTVGDPMKDVAGPALLIFMKLMGMASLLIAAALK